jgi:hypothetical protein
MRAVPSYSRDRVLRFLIFRVFLISKFSATPISGRSGCWRAVLRLASNSANNHYSPGSGQRRFN